MPLSPNINDREFDKFDLNNTDETCVRVCGDLDTTPSGLGVAGLITEVTLDSSTWTALPSTAQSGRNTLGLQNTSGTQIKLNFDNSVVGYTGWIVPDGGEFFIDVTNNIAIYAKSQAGTPTITVMELS